MDFTQDSTRTATPQAPQRGLGEELTDFYAENADDFEPNGVTPEVVARHYYDTSGTDDDYDTWANRHNIGSFIAGAPTAVETARKKAAWDAAQPESRGFLSGSAAAFGRGVMDTVGAVGRTMQLADATPSAIDTDKGLMDRAGEGLTAWTEEKKAKTQFMRPTKEEDAGEVGTIKTGWEGALESLPLTGGVAASALAGGAAGSVVPGIGTAAGAVIGHTSGQGE